MNNFGGLWLPGRGMRNRQVNNAIVLICLFLSVSACSTPVGVKRIDPRTVHRALTTNVLSTNTLSTPTQNVLYRRDLSVRFENDPEGYSSTGHTI